MVQNISISGVSFNYGASAISGTYEGEVFVSNCSFNSCEKMIINGGSKGRLSMMGSQCVNSTFELASQLMIISDNTFGMLLMIRFK